MILFLKNPPSFADLLSPSFAPDPATQAGVRSDDESVLVHQRYALISAKMMRRTRSALRRRLEEEWRKAAIDACSSSARRSVRAGGKRLKRAWVDDGGLGRRRDRSEMKALRAWQIHIQGRRRGSRQGGVFQGE